ncbi:MAG: ATP-binding protein, partial [Bacteroidota bacterium]
RLSGYWMRGCFPSTSFLVNADMERIPGLETGLNTVENWFHVLPIDSDRYLIALYNSLKIYSAKNGKIISTLQANGFDAISSFQLDGQIYLLGAAGNCLRLDSKNLNWQPVQLNGFSNQSIRLEKVLWNYYHDQTFLISNKELYRIESAKDKKSLTLTPITNQLPENCFISEIIYDNKSGSYFVGTSTKGLYIYRKKSMRTLLAEDSTSIYTNCFYSQIELDSSRVYTEKGWEFTIDGASRSKLNLEMGSAQLDFHLKDGKFIYYPANGLLNRYDLESNTRKTISAIPRTYFSSLKVRDTIYLTSSSGLHCLLDDSLHFLIQTGMSGFDQRITSIIETREGNLWLAHCNGILSYNPKTKKISSVPEMEGKCVRIIEPIKNLYMIGTYGSGYFFYADGKFYQPPIDQQEKLSKTHNFHLDNNELLWMATNTGLVNTPFKDIIAYINDTTTSPYYYHYEIEDGIINTEFNGGCTPTHIRLRNGYLSYPTMEGLVWFKPELAVRDLPDENIFLDEVLINNLKYEYNGVIQIGGREDEVVIHFSSPYWGTANNIQLEYRILGFTNKWKTTEGGGRWIDFANLPHGEYTLEIRNMVSSNEKDAAYLKIPMKVMPEFYETWGFLVGGIFSGIIVLFGLFKLNSARIIRQNKDLEDQVAERTIELQSTNLSLNSAIKNLQDKEYKLKESIRIKDKLISIISHDIITPIKFLSIVSNVSNKIGEGRTVDQKESEENMKYIGAAAEKIYNNAANILNWIKLQNELIRIEPENIGLYDFVDDVISPLDAVIDRDSIQMINDVSEEEIIFADPNILKIVLQNILSNSVKYTKSGTIRVESAQDNKGFTVIRVTDTGMGMPQKIIDKIGTIKKQTVKGEFDADDPDTGNQLGYFIIFDFARLLDGDVDIRSELGKGTVVTLTLHPSPRI